VNSLASETWRDQRYEAETSTQYTLYERGVELDEKKAQSRTKKAIKAAAASHTAFEISFAS
jgi:hypothetical protein